MQLKATDAERRDIGGALNDAIASFDEAAPFVKLLNLLGPWAGVIDGIAEALFTRAIYIAQHRVPKGAAVDRDVGTQPGRPIDNGRSSSTADDDDTIYAPNPAGGN